MRSIFRIAVLVGVALTTPAQAQVKRAGDEEKPRIHRMEIYNNGVRTVRYFGSAGLSRGEDSVMRDLERAENEMSYIDDLQVVKSLYLASERILEPHRRIVQEQLYGLSSTTSGFAGASAFAPYSTRYPFYGAFGYGYGYGAPSATAFAGDSYSVTRSLAEGIGPEGATKEALVQAIARQATPEYSAAVQRDYDRLLARASSSPTLAAAFGLQGGKDPVRAAGDDSDAGIILTLKDGDRVEGTKLTEDKDWYVLEKANGRTVRVRKSEVTRLDLPKGTKVKPAS